MAKASDSLRFGDVAEFRNGLNFAKSSRGKGCSLIGVPDFQNRFTPNYDELAEIDPTGIVKPEDYVEKGDILFVRSNGNKELVGRSLFIDREITALFSGFCIRARIHSEKVDPAFCAYFTKTATFRSSISGHVGTSINNLNQGILGDIALPPVPLSDQKAIVSVLSALDAKIELNQRMNEELEGMAKLLYDYWFVQYDFPMSAAQAKALGKPHLTGHPYRASGGPMTYHETLKREIPKGWEVGNLPDIATFTNGIACQKYPADGGPTLRVIKIKEMRDGITDDSDVVTAKVPEKVKIKNGDILFSWSASLEVMIWTGGEGALNQHIFKVTSDTHPRSYCYFVLLDYLRHFQMIADLRKTTMGHITLDHLEQSRITLPDSAIVEQFEVATKPLIERMIKAHEETQELTTLRDWLLPMLMNGQVTVGGMKTGGL